MHTSTHSSSLYPLHQLVRKSFKNSHVGCPDLLTLLTEYARANHRPCKPLCLLSGGDNDGHRVNHSSLYNHYTATLCQVSAAHCCLHTASYVWGSSHHRRYRHTQGATERCSSPSHFLARLQSLPRLLQALEAVEVPPSAVDRVVRVTQLHLPTHHP